MSEVGTMKGTARNKTAAKHDWSHLDDGSGKHAAAMSDQDNRPLTEARPAGPTSHSSGCKNPWARSGAPAILELGRPALGRLDRALVDLIDIALVHLDQRHLVELHLERLALDQPVGLLDRLAANQHDLLRDHVVDAAGAH